LYDIRLEELWQSVKYAKLSMRLDTFFKKHALALLAWLNELSLKGRRKPRYVMQQRRKSITEISYLLESELQGKRVTYIFVLEIKASHALVVGSR